MTAIVRAVETFDPPEPLSSSSSYRKDHSNDSTGSFSVFRAPSTTSLETGLTGMSSGTTGSHNSAYSHGSKHSFGSMNSLKSKERRRRRRMPTRTPKHSLDEGPRLFQCTFCTDRFKSKYDWSRHEKSLHLSLEVRRSRYILLCLISIAESPTHGPPAGKRNTTGFTQYVSAFTYRKLFLKAFNR